MGRSVRALVVRVIVVFDEFRNFRILDLTFLYRVDAGESVQLFLYQVAENGTPTRSRAVTASRCR